MNEIETQEKLIVENQKLVGFIINKHNLKHKFDELVDVGMIGLVKGVKTFDKTRGIKANTYLCHCIETEIFNYLRPFNTLKRGKNVQTVSLDLKVYIGNNEVSLYDFITDDSYNIEDMIIKKEEILELRKSLDILTDVEKYILFHSYEIDDYKKLTQYELASNIKKSQAQVNRILKNAIKKLRKELKHE